MPTRLYLDTARLGLMSASAQQIHIDFVRFVGEEAASLYFDQFLRTGVRDWPASLRRRFPALQAWQGISHLKDDLRRPVGASAQSNVLLASRSAQLMKLAAKLLFRLCRNVLVTDLSWPSYRQILKRVGGTAENRLTTLQLRRSLLRDQVPQDEVIERIAQHFVRTACDGLFLPAVDNLGIRLPIEQIVRSIEKRAELRFVVVDGAQAFGHTPLELSEHTVISSSPVATSGWRIPADGIGFLRSSTILCIYRRDCSPATTGRRARRPVIAVSRRSGA